MNQSPKKLAFNIPHILPVLPLRGTVIFPDTAEDEIYLSRRLSVRALHAAIKGNGHLLLVPQKGDIDDEPASVVDFLHSFGTVAHVVDVEVLEDDTVKLVMNPLHRGHISMLCQICPSMPKPLW